MIITLCGSARFEKTFHAWNKALSLSGHTVLGLSTYPALEGGNKDWCSPAEKVILDKVHKDKIAIAHVALFLNCFGYMGESTLSELNYALRISKRLFFLESWGKGNGISANHHQAAQDACKAHGVPFHASPTNTFELGNCSPSELLAHECGPERTRLLKLVGLGQP